MNKTSKIVSTFLSYRSQLQRAVGKIVRSEDVDDIVQETFVKSYEAELKQEIQYERTYMLRTAKHLALNHISRFSQKYEQPIEDNDASAVYLKTNALEKDVESKERFLDFCRATDTLSPEVKRVFILKKVYGLSQREIAAHLDISQSTVEKHVAKGLLLCSRYLKQQAADNSPNPSRATGK